MNPLTAFTWTAGLLAAAALAFAAGQLAKMQRKQSRLALLDTGEGLKVGRWFLDGNRIGVHCDGKDSYYEPSPLGESVVIESKYGVQRWRMFVQGRMGNLEVPLRRHLQFPREMLEDLADQCLLWLPTQEGGPKQAAIDTKAIEAYATSNNYDAQLVRSAAIEIQKAIRGGEADVFMETSWRKFVLNYKEQLGFGAFALVIVGVMFGIQLMTDPYFYAFFTRNDSQWIMLGLLAIATVGITWGSSK